MSKEIRELQPRAVWNKFADLNSVPRPSKKEDRIIKFMVEFGNALGLETITDPVGNVIIRKPATEGMEDRLMVTLQSHLDMVHQKNKETAFNFDTDGIQMTVEGDWVTAKGTTLGADNGLGVAAIMALLESVDIPHPPLEALFTIDEEAGMTGAKELKPGVLKGKILLNLDTEEDDEIDIGCAGGIDVTASRSYSEENFPNNCIAFQIKIKGLQGGHSGMDIHRGLGNANKIMNRLLYRAHTNYNIRITEIDGGGLRNAIPRESTATIAVNKGKKKAFVQDLKNWSETAMMELSITEPQLNIELETIEPPKTVMETVAQGKILSAIYAAHNGVYSMSTAISDLVETSNNIAKVNVKAGQIKISCLTRSSVDSAKMDLATSLKAAFELAGCEVVFDGHYPGWNPNPDSSILKVLTAKYRSLFGEMPKVVACHAGLECGILGKNYPEMDMVSFGPTIKGAHSPDERAQIASVQKFWRFLLEILKDIPREI
ncbi:aminoacyl-histidine dipeptidase [Flavobacteriaceae bacterium F89]|uniref:Cytosol non-specific dipeptidase n=1 Tax=Cerina litoralis TaxID=2874477 RepID=A0AAE3JMI1_9FLAO|nr:aminoacyl-histidine dipeptidase [Cerina litoralis]MCG2459885.1 aminoacyl-histidine dipeptidase [Cerina litoralis]